MNFKEICDEVKEMVVPYHNDYNTVEVRAAIIDCISDHGSVGSVIDKTTESDIDNQRAKFGVEIGGIYATITVPLL